MTVLKLVVILGRIDFLDDVDAKLNLALVGVEKPGGRGSGQVHFARLTCNVVARLSRHLGDTHLAIATRKVFVRDVCCLVGQSFEIY